MRQQAVQTTGFGHGIEQVAQGMKDIRQAATQTATGTVQSYSQFSIQFTSAQGATVTLPFYATTAPLTAS